MRVVLQRVRRASVDVGGERVSEIGPGLLLLVGVAPGDGEAEVRWLADKVTGLRIFADDDGKMNRSVLDAGGEVLVVSQFTLYGDIRKGRRPSFVGAAHPSIAEPLYASFCDAVAACGVKKVGRGVFGAMMDVELVNDGPVTLILDSP